MCESDKFGANCMAIEDMAERLSKAAEQQFDCDGMPSVALRTAIAHARAALELAVRLAGIEV